ncbi:hypothetical protein HPB52_000005 [Rhipicephalus sanguineus]|uniref:Peptidase S54 rhomboid domain-containing protein n=1 Tax=Rhipicephalus sanguineus TaxID=34632 RepID=A0A9D4QBA0_RHISA|nr:hypothetical protein HPB52_000005 [Rhipicephalus sanguineus]
MIPKEEITKEDQAERKGKQDAESSSVDAVSSNSAPEPHPSAGVHVSTTVATQPNTADAASQEQVGSGVSEVSIASVPLTSGSSLPRQQIFESAMPSSVLPGPLPNVVSEASQTLDPAPTLYRSLTLQYSPSRTQQNSTPELQFADSFAGLPSAGQETSATSPSQETQDPTSWSSFSLSNLLSSLNFTNRPVLRNAPQYNNFNSAENVVSTTFASIPKQGSGTLPSKLEDGEDPVLVESRTLLVPWSLSPRRLDRMIGSPQAIEDPPSSPVTTSPSPVLDFPESASPEVSQSGETFDEPRVPYFTLFVTMLQMRAHWNFLHKYYPERCASISTVVEEGLWERALFAAFHHKNVIHLLSNLTSFLVSGLVLEAALGSAYFGVVFAALVCLVGLVHTSLVLTIYEHTLEPHLAASCAHTFAGVTVAADILTRTHYGGSKIRYGSYEFEYTSLWVLLGELFVLYGVSADNLLPMASGLLVGGLLAKTRLGRCFVRAPSPARHVNLYVIPNAPVTFLLCVSIIVAHMCGPYLNHSHTAQPTLTFQDPVWQPPILPALYLPNIFQVQCVINYLWKVGRELEQDLGHLSFLRTVVGLLFGVNLMLDVVGWATRMHTIALRTDQPSPVAHSSCCGCGVVGVLMALAIVHHDRYNARRVPLALFSVPVPFWVEVMLSLAFFSWIMPAGSSVGHVIGVLLGLAVVNVKSEHFANCIPAVGSASARSSPRESTEAAPGALRSHLIGIRRYLFGC